MIVSDGNQASVEPTSGRREAFEDIISTNQRMIHTLCHRMTGSLEDAEDLAQETFVQAYRHLDEFREESQISSWLYRIAVNRCLNWQRRRMRQDQMLQEWSRHSAELNPGDFRRVCQIQDALLRLPAKQRAAVVLTTYDGLTHAEAANVLDCSETTVSWRLFAARRKLKKLLSKIQNTGGES